ncbi:MAG: hypothetical protein V3U92_15175 [Cellulophaga sp.]
MVQKIFDNIITGSKFLCVEILFNETGAQYHIIEVLKEKNNLSISSYFFTTDFDYLLSIIPKDKPTLLSFNGHGVITKKVENSTNYQSKILFNADPEEFYWYEVKQQEHVYASVVRKRSVNDVMSEFDKHNIAIVDVSIGPFVVVAAKPLLSEYAILTTQGFELHFNKNELSGFKIKQHDNVNENYTIGDEKIKVGDIVSFSTVLNYLYPNEEIEIDKQFLEIRRQEFVYKKAFNAIGSVSLILFLTSLLVSYFLLSHYQGEYLKGQVAFEEQNIAYSKLLLLEKDKANKEAILNESGLNDSNFLSYYISEITKEVPAEINLSELYIFPVKNKIKPGQRIEFNNDLLEIAGSASTNLSFTNWIKVLRGSPWVTNIEIVDFTRDGATNAFKIKLTLKFDV